MQRPENTDRDRFDAFVKHIASMGLVDGERVAATQLPARSLYEYCFDTQEGVWKSWRSYLQPYEPPADGAFSKILVPTVDVVRWVLGLVSCAAWAQLDQQQPHASQPRAKRKPRQLMKELCKDHVSPPHCLTVILPVQYRLTFQPV